MATGSNGSKPRRPGRRTRPRVTVLRIGHRAGRDPRLTTHVALVARAFGAEAMLLHPADPDLSARVAGVTRRWGGSFAVQGVDDWKRVIREFPGAVVHLTMYGLPLARALSKIRDGPRVLLVVGGAKVPPELYRHATFNVAVGAQPHSEVAAVAIALDRLIGPTASKDFRGAEQRIVPQSRGKKIARRESRP